jgi:hypothetical protein
MLRFGVVRVHFLGIYLKKGEFPLQVYKDEPKFSRCMNDANQEASHPLSSYASRSKHIIVRGLLSKLGCKPIDGTHVPFPILVNIHILVVYQPQRSGPGLV